MDTFDGVERNNEASALLVNVTTHGALTDSDNTGNVQIQIRTNPIQTGSSWFAAGFLVINAALGAGLLNFPAAYHAAGGVTVALSIQLFLMVFIIMALFILAYCSDVTLAATYQDVIYAICGRGMYIVCSICITVYCFGTCITFLIIIGDMLDRIFVFVAGANFCHTWYMNRKFTMTVSCCVLVLPLCFPKRIDFLKYASFLGFVGVVYLILLVVCKYYLTDITPGPIATSPHDFVQVFNVVPAICFGYQCHVSVIPIYACLADRNLKQFAKVIVMAMILCIITYSIGAVYGYWTFGADVEPDILESYEPDAAVLAGIIMFAAKNYTTYPILLFCGRAGVESLRLILFPNAAQDTYRSETIRRFVVTSLWFLATVVLAVFIPDIGQVIQFLGALAAAFIFWFPGFCLLHLGLTSRDMKQTLKADLMILLAMVFIVFGTFMAGIVVVQGFMSGGQAQHMRPCT